MANKTALAQKESVINEIVDKIDNSSSVLVWEYTSSNVETIQKIRTELKQSGATTKVYKNTLAKLAFEKKGYNELADKIVGQNSFAFASEEDEVATARVIKKYMKDNEDIKFKAGIFEGKIVEPDALTELSLLPSKDNLISMLLSVLQANTRNLAYAISQVGEQKTDDTAAPKVETKEEVQEEIKEEKKEES